MSGALGLRNLPVGSCIPNTFASKHKPDAVRLCAVPKPTSMHRTCSPGLDSETQEPVLSPPPNKKQDTIQGSGVFGSTWLFHGC